MARCWWHTAGGRRLDVVLVEHVHQHRLVVLQHFEFTQLSGMCLQGLAMQGPRSQAGLLGYAWHLWA